MDHDKLWKILRDGNTRPPYLPPGNLYVGQEATVRTGHGTMLLLLLSCFGRVGLCATPWTVA